MPLAVSSGPTGGHRQRAQQQPLTLQQHLQQAQAALQVLHTQQQRGGLDLERTRQLLHTVKAFVALTALDSLHDPSLVKAVALVGREGFEIAAFCAVEEMRQLRRRRVREIGAPEDEDEAVEGDEFERCMMMLLPYYTDYAGLLPVSKHRNELLCLHMLYYLASNRIGEFHMALEALPPDVRADSLTQRVLQLEQHLIEGSYGELLRPRPTDGRSSSRRSGSRVGEHQQSTSSLVAALSLPPSAQVFIDKLVRTVRLKVAACMEKAHSSVDAAYAIQALGLSGPQELQQFVVSRNSGYSRPPDPLAEYLNPPVHTAPAGRGPGTSSTGGVGGGRDAGAEAARALAAGVGSTSFTSLPSFSATVEPQVRWHLERGIITFIKKGEAAAQAQQQHCSVQAMQLLGNLISYATELERIV